MSVSTKHYIAYMVERGSWAVKHRDGLHALPPVALGVPTSRDDAIYVAKLCERLAPHASPTEAGDGLVAAGFPQAMRTWIDPRYQRGPVDRHFAGLIGGAA